MRAVSFLLIGGLALVASGAYAGYDASGLRTSWGASMSKCPSPNFTSSNGCLSNCDSNSNGKNAMIAQEINANGALFCPTYVISNRNLTVERPWTQYHWAQGTSETDCVWLCKSGYTGEKCNTKVSEATTCDKTLLQASTYTGKANVCSTSGWWQLGSLSCSTSSVESKVAMFSSAYYDCNDERFNEEPSVKYQEHDNVLGIVGWLSSGHGAYAQPLIVDAWCGNGKSDGDCKIIIAPVGTKRLLCKDGYKPNSGNTDCVAINQYVCDGVKNCSGWDSSRFTGSSYKTIVKGGCIQYRCAKDGFGFKDSPTKDNTCVECKDTDTQKATLLASNGQCMFTDKTVKVSVSASGTVTTTPLAQATKTDMVKDYDGAPCWVRESPTEYKACLLGKTPKIISENGDVSKVMYSGVSYNIRYKLKSSK